MPRLQQRNDADTFVTITEGTAKWTKIGFMGTVIVERCISLSHAVLIPVLSDAVIAASANGAVRLCWHAQLKMKKLKTALNI